MKNMGIFTGHMKNILLRKKIIKKIILEVTNTLEFIKYIVKVKHL